MPIICIYILCLYILYSYILCPYSTYIYYPSISLRSLTQAAEALLLRLVVEQLHGHVAPGPAAQQRGALQSALGHPPAVRLRLQLVVAEEPHGAQVHESQKALKEIEILFIIDIIDAQ